MPLRFPTAHLADETAARIMVAAKRIRERDAVHIGELAPELTGQPTPAAAAAEAASSGAVAATATAQATGGQPAAPPAPGNVPPLDQSGMDQGALMRGRSPYTALADGISDQQGAK